MRSVNVKLGSRIAVAASTLVLGATLGAARADAGPNPKKVFDFCATKTADATRTLGPNVVAVSAQRETDINFKPGTCPSFVVDVKVPYNSSAPNRKRNFSLVGDPGWNAQMPHVCTGTTETTTLYKKSGKQTKFTKVATTKTRGKWHANSLINCTMETEPGYSPLHGHFLPPLKGTDVYRIAKDRKFGFHVTVTVGVEHDPLPPS